ncbi:mucin-desulfating sulfatase (N-acetylglucosamine-6-sulfatase) [gut metagenome]|uniref:Mucin-desulfating sulfatase (N-acetylglucosamine-6-sulfatase) n=1 Tax=gut metagenome TaxID=749906 RepID=J9GUF8_9ZZZZ
MDSITAAAASNSSLLINPRNNMQNKKLLMLAPALFPALVAAQERYNIVYIMTDDHTAQMMSCYDNRFVETPNLDRIANDGVKFVNSYVANSLSGPSRACMLTGKHSHANGFTNNEHGIFNGAQQTMPKLLQKAGYQTAIIGKWHLVSEPTGFDYWNILPGQGDYYNPTFINMDGSRNDEKGYLTNIVTDKGIDWLENKRDKSKPFILFLHHKACHRDWLPELKYLHEYEDKTFALPENFYDNYEGRKAAAQQEMSIASNHDMDMAYDVKIYHPDQKSRLRPSYLNYIGRLNTEDRAVYDHFYDSISLDFQKQHLTGNALTEYKYQRYMRDYAKVLKSLDDNIGRTLDYLEKSGLSKNTLVVYTSDQGFYMGEHGWFDKRFMYEESFSTPLVMMLPEGLQARGDIKELVQNIDYAPTFLDIAGAPIPEDIHGESLLPLLKGEHPKNWRKSLYYHFYEYPAEHMVKRHYGVRTADGWKLIHFYNDIDEWELYNLNEDPNEMNNIYGKPGTEKIPKKLRKELKKLQEEYKDPILEKYPL